MTRGSGASTAHARRPGVSVREVTQASAVPTTDAVTATDAPSTMLRPSGANVSCDPNVLHSSPPSDRLLHTR
jgi:hypothetical protein